MVACRMKRTLNMILCAAIMALVSACAGRQQVAVTPVDVPQNRYAWSFAEPSYAALFCPLGYGRDGALLWVRFAETADSVTVLELMRSAHDGTAVTARLQGTLRDNVDSLWSLHRRNLSAQLAAAGYVSSPVECAQLPVTAGGQTVELYVEADSAAGPEAGANWITGVRVMARRGWSAPRELTRIDAVAVYDLVLPGWVAAPDGNGVFVVYAEIVQGQNGIYTVKYNIIYQNNSVYE